MLVASMNIREALQASQLTPAQLAELADVPGERLEAVLEGRESLDAPSLARIV